MDGVKKQRVKYFAGAFAWGAVSKTADAAIKFFTIPLLISWFGKDDFGVLSLVLAINAYSQLLDFGLNSGAVKFFSQWMSKKQYVELHHAAATCLGLYLLVGIINLGVLILVGSFAGQLFHLSEGQMSLFVSLIEIVAWSTIIQWLATVGNQLLIANHEVAITHKISALKSFGTGFAVAIVIKFGLSVQAYLGMVSIIGVVAGVYSLISARTKGFLASFTPSFDFKSIWPILVYSGGIFAMGVFQFTASQSRPLVLAGFSEEVASVMAEYRVVEVFPLFLVSIGSLILGTLMPTAFNAVHSDDKKLIAKILHEGTRLCSLIVCGMCIPVALLAEDLLYVYAGKEYVHLSIWLAFWCLAIILALQNNPVSSVILAKGRTRAMIVSSGAACIISLVINAVLANRFGVGSAVIGYLVYVIIQAGVQYAYIIPVALQESALRIGAAFIWPLVDGVAIGLMVWSVLGEILDPGLLRGGILAAAFLLLFSGAEFVRNRDLILRATIGLPGGRFLNSCFGPKARIS